MKRYMLYDQDTRLLSLSGTRQELFSLSKCDQVLLNDRAQTSSGNVSHEYWSLAKDMESLFRDVVELMLSSLKPIVTNSQLFGCVQTHLANSSLSISSHFPSLDCQLCFCLIIQRHRSKSMMTAPSSMRLLLLLHFTRETQKALLSRPYLPTQMSPYF